MTGSNHVEAWPTKSTRMSSTSIGVTGAKTTRPAIISRVVNTTFSKLLEEMSMRSSVDGELRRNRGFIV